MPIENAPALIVISAFSAELSFVAVSVVLTLLKVVIVPLCEYDPVAFVVPVKVIVDEPALKLVPALFPWLNVR